MVMSDSPPTLQTSLRNSPLFPSHTYVTASSENPLLSFGGGGHKADGFRKDADKDKDTELLVLQRSLEAEQHQSNLLRQSLKAETKRCEEVLEQLAALKHEVVKIRETNKQVLTDQDVYISQMEEAIRSENTYLKGALAEANLAVAEVARLKKENQDLKDKLSEARIAAATAQVEHTTRQMHHQEFEVESSPMATQASYVEVPEVVEEEELPRSAKKKIDFGIKRHQESPGTLLKQRTATEESVRRAIPYGLKATPSLPASTPSLVAPQTVPLDVYDKARVHNLRPPLTTAAEESHSTATVVHPEARAEAPLLVPLNIRRHQPWLSSFSSLAESKPEPPIDAAHSALVSDAQIPVVTTLPPGVSPALYRPVSRTQNPHPLAPRTAPNTNTNTNTNNMRPRGGAGVGYPLFAAQSRNSSSSNGKSNGNANSDSKENFSANYNNVQKGGSSGTSSAVFRIPTLDFSKLKAGPSGPVLAGSQTERVATTQGGGGEFAPWQPLEDESPLNSARSLPSYPPTYTAPSRSSLLAASRFSVLRERGGYPLPRAVEELQPMLEAYF